MRGITCPIHYLPSTPGVTAKELLACPTLPMLGWACADLVSTEIVADLLVVGKEATVVVIASCKRHLTSSAVDRSRGVCPS